jgi:hypothetical protein
MNIPNNDFDAYDFSLLDDALIRSMHMLNRHFDQRTTSAEKLTFLNSKNLQYRNKLLEIGSLCELLKEIDAILRPSYHPKHDDKGKKPKKPKKPKPPQAELLKKRREALLRIQEKCSRLGKLWDDGIIQGEGFDTIKNIPNKRLNEIYRHVTFGTKLTNHE